MFKIFYSAIKFKKDGCQYYNYRVVESKRTERGVRLILSRPIIPLRLIIWPDYFLTTPWFTALSGNR